MKNVNASISQFMIQSTIGTKQIELSSSSQKQRLVQNFEQESSFDKIYCLQCEQNLQKITQFRKNQIQLEYQIIKLNEKIQKLEKDNSFLIKRIQDKQKDQIVQIHTHNMESVQNVIDDLQAELFESKFINQLLILNKYHSDQPLAQKYEKIMIENLRLQEQLITKDKIIKQKQFYPLYHYNNRVKFLRDSLLHWHKIATKQCKQVRKGFGLIRQDTQILIKNTKERVTQQIKNFMNQNQSLSLIKLDKQKEKSKAKKQNASFLLERKNGKQKVIKVEKEKQKVNKSKCSVKGKKTQKISKQKRCCKENCFSNS